MQQRVHISWKEHMGVKHPELKICLKYTIRNLLLLKTNFVFKTTDCPIRDRLPHRDSNAALALN